MTTGFEALLTQQIVKRNIFPGMDQECFRGGGGEEVNEGCLFPREAQ